VATGGIVYLFLVLMVSKLRDVGRRRMAAAFLCFVAACGALALGGCVPRAPRAPRAVDGVLDLREWSFEADGPVRLDGEWEFAWGAFVAPGDQAVPRLSGTASVPGVWNGLETGRGPAPAYGYATYRLRILMPAHRPPLAIKMLDAATATALYAQGTLIMESGTPGDSPRASLPSFRPGVAAVPPAGDTIVLVAHVSNYHYRSGGLWESLQLGTEADMRALRTRGTSTALVLFGCLVAFGLYELGMALFVRGEESVLAFALACFLAAFRVITTGERVIVLLVPSIEWQLLARIAYLSFYLSVPAFVVYTRLLFPAETSPVLARISVAVCLLFSALVVATPAAIYSHTVVAYQALTVVVCAWLLFAAHVARRHKRDGATLFLAASGVIFLGGLNDILYSRLVINTTYVFPFTVVSFVLIQAFLLSLRVTRSLQTVLEQRREIQEASAAYRNELEQRRQAQRALEEATQIISRSPAVALLWRAAPGWPVEYASENAASVFGYTALDLTSGAVRYDQVIHPDDIERVSCEVREASGPAGPSTIDHVPYRVVTKDAGVRWVHDRTVIERDAAGAAIHYRGIVEDVTDRVEAEHALSRYRDGLEDIVRQRTAELEHARATAEAASRAKSEFVAHISHELRTPLNHIIGFTELVARKQVGELNEAQVDYLNDALASGRHLLSLINDVLDLARVESGRETLAPVDVDIAAVVAASLTVISQQAAESGVRTATALESGLPPLRADERKLRQVLYNLLSNAVKFAGRGGTVVVRARSADGGVRIDVVDTGVGIETADLERIFEPFEQAHAPSSGRIKGTGLGLPIARRLVEIHGGRLWAESGGPGAGSTFVVELPCVPCATDATPTEPPLPRGP
jgi:PAS domain S-box-containing protein